MSWRTRWRISEYLRNSIWLVPGVFALAAYLLGRIPPDAASEADFPVHYGPEAARSLLGALASGMIAFTGFVFSILLLAVQFGSSQFSPRMLRRFLRDPTTKVSLGVFMATFIFSLLVLRVVGTAEEQDIRPQQLDLDRPAPAAAQHDHVPAPDQPHHPGAAGGGGRCENSAATRRR